MIYEKIRVEKNRKLIFLISTLQCIGYIYWLWKSSMYIFNFTTFCIYVFFALFRKLLEPPKRRKITHLGLPLLPKPKMPHGFLVELRIEMRVGRKPWKAIGYLIEPIRGKNFMILPMPNGITVKFIANIVIKMATVKQ